MKIVAVVLAAVAAPLAWIALGHLLESAPPPPPAVHLAFPAPPDVELGSGDEPLDAAISPDGTEVVFVGTRGGVQQLWRRRLGEERARALIGTDGAHLPAWKQTGNVIAFFANGRLKQSPGDGVVHDLAAAPAPRGATWLRDGSLLFAADARGPLQRIRDGRAERATRLAGDDVAHAFPAAVPGTDDFVYVAIRQDGRRMIRFVRDGDTRDLIPTSGHGALVANYLLHVRDGVLMAYQWDPDALTLAPRGMPLGLNAGVTASGRALFAAAPSLLVYAASTPRLQELAWVDFSGVRAAPLADAGDYWQVRLSPDDRFAAVTMRDPLLRALDIAIVPTAAPGNTRRLTTAVAAETDPVWSPDGEYLLFRSLEGGTPALVTRRPGAPEQPVEVMLHAQFDAVPSDWIGRRADGTILFHRRDTESSNLWVLQRRGGEGVLEPLVLDPFNETDARWSPDGRWIAYVSDESGQPDIYVRRPAAPRIRVSFAGGTRPRWTRDGSAVLFLRGSQVMRADRVDGGFAPARELFASPGLRDYDVAHRTDRIVALLGGRGAVTPPPAAWLNWTSRLRFAGPGEHRDADDDLVQ